MGSSRGLIEHSLGTCLGVSAACFFQVAQLFESFYSATNVGIFRVPEAFLFSNNFGHVIDYLRAFVGKDVEYCLVESGFSSFED